MDRSERDGRRGGGHALLVGAFALLAHGCGEPAPPPPNLVLISIDTLRPDFLGCYGYDRDTSPALDRVAQQGTLFEDVTSASPWTLPSHASMITGLYPSSHGVKDHDRQLTKETLATMLKRVGFQTFAVVNTKNIGMKRFGLLRGFDESHYENELDLHEGRPDLITNKGRPITKKALEYLKGRDAERPFFLFLHYYDVHTDFTPDPQWELEFVEPYSGPLTGNTQQLANYRSQNRPLTPEDRLWLEQMYEAEIRTLDEILEGLFDYLDASGLAQNTVLAITSDHGEEYGEHGSVLHGRTYYEEVIRIPMILRGPGIPAGQRVAEPVHLVDLAPTLLGLLGVPAREPMDGIDLGPALVPGGTVPLDRLLFGEADHNNTVDGEEVSDIRRMVRDGYEKLLYDTVTGEKELYDLAEDAAEARDLVGTRPERVEALWRALEEFMAKDTGGGARELEPMDAELVRELERLGY